MKFERAEENLCKVYKKRSNSLVLLLDSICKSDAKCVKVIDDEGQYNNNNDLARGISQCIDRCGYKNILKSFMLNGEVYIKKVRE